jgi:hypothetical protein
VLALSGAGRQQPWAGLRPTLAQPGAGWRPALLRGRRTVLLRGRPPVPG